MKVVIVIELDYDRQISETEWHSYIEDIEDHRLFVYDTPIRVIETSLDSISGRVIATN